TAWLSAAATGISTADRLPRTDRISESADRLSGPAWIHGPSRISWPAGGLSDPDCISWPTGISGSADWFSGPVRIPGSVRFPRPAWWHAERAAAGDAADARLPGADERRGPAHHRPDPDNATSRRAIGHWAFRIPGDGWRPHEPAGIRPADRRFSRRRFANAGRHGAGTELVRQQVREQHFRRR